MDKEQLDKFSAPLVEVYKAIEDRILLNLARRIAKDEDLLIEIENQINLDGTPQLIQAWQLQRLAELGDLTQENIAIIAEYTGKTRDEVQSILEGVGYTAVDEIEGELQEGAEKGSLTMPPPMRESQVMGEVLMAYQYQALETFNLTNSALIQEGETTFRDMINNITGMVLSGESTPREARREALRNLAETGVPALRDKKGRKWQPEVYVSMVLRTTTGKVANSMQERRMDEFGADLVEISSHSGARPKCAPFQGKIFSRSGNHGVFPALSSTSMGEPDGLLGINCGHRMYPYIQGVSRKTYEPYPKRENGRVYKEQQQQRKIERSIRKAKRELDMMTAVNDEIAIREAKSKVRQQQQTMRNFISQTGRTRRYDREQIE